MCGLVGFLTNNDLSEDSLRVDVANMASAIQNRGPDDAGVWVDGNSGIALGHRRLSIVDLSEAGHQPMQSASGRYVIAFNGEIYNHKQLRRELDLQNRTNSNSPASNITWKGCSDTETLLAGFDFWGIQNTIKRSVGMFAFAVWDREMCLLTLGRDRLGEKPLYFGWQPKGQKDVFLFGSELKALKAHPSFQADVDRDALCMYMRLAYVPAPHSIYKGISKLEPGTLMTISLKSSEPKYICYWSAADVANAGCAEPFTGNSQNAVDELDVLLRSVIKQQMVADVPLGAFLSGGIDSSTVVALMQSQHSEPVKTFTIGYEENVFNEADHAKEISKYLGTDHTELYISSQHAIDIIPLLPKLYCEPFADSSQIPTFLVSQLARQHVSVSLSGDGGDEIFCGYNRYLLASKLWKKLSLLPLTARTLVSHALLAVSPKTWNALIDPIQVFLPTSVRQINWGDKLHKGANVLASSNLDKLYLGLVSQWNDPACLVIDGHELPALINLDELIEAEHDNIQSMMLLDVLTYLPDDILVKLDRATMGASLEGRTPFLDHRVVEFAWKLPQSMKLRNDVGKWILREVLHRYVPKSLIERPKMGFGVPIGDWLRGPLKEWAEALLDEDRLRREGYFHPTQIRLKWTEHLSGSRNWQSHLWNVLMFQLWLEQQ